MKWSFSMHLTAQILNRSPAFKWDGSLSVYASSICSSTFRMPRLRRSAASAMTRHLARGRSNAQFKEKSKTPYPKQSCLGRLGPKDRIRVDYREGKWTFGH